MPSLASLLHMRLAAGESFPRVKPCAKTPQPRTAASGRSIRPASIGPLVLANDTRSAMSHMVSKLVAAPRSQPTPRTSAIRHYECVRVPNRNCVWCRKEAWCNQDLTPTTIHRSILMSRCPTIQGPSRQTRQRLCLRRRSNRCRAQMILTASLPRSVCRRGSSAHSLLMGGCSELALSSWWRRLTAQAAVVASPTATAIRTFAHSGRARRTPEPRRGRTRRPSQSHSCFA
jgi:hypothetical protein